VPELFFGRRRKSVVKRVEKGGVEFSVVCVPLKERLFTREE